MAAPSVTNTFVANTTASASEVNANFTNIVEGLSSGTNWDIYASSLNCASITASSAVVINEAGADVDFRVEGDTNTHLLFCDAGNDIVNIGTSNSPPLSGSGITAKLNVVESVESGGPYIIVGNDDTNTSVTTQTSGIIFAVSAGSTTLYPTARIYGYKNGTYGGVPSNRDGGLKIDVVVNNTLSNIIDIDSDKKINLANGVQLSHGVANVGNIDVTDLNKIQFGSIGSNYFPTMSASSSAITGLTLQGASPDANTFGDMIFSVLENDNSDYATTTRDAFIWRRYATTIMSLTRSGNLDISGALSKGSGSFKIDHPLEEKSETHNLVHSFVEAPQADNIYRGKAELVNGQAIVNIDETSGMTEGTFEVLNREIQVFTSNESGWTPVKGIVEGNILTITSKETCQDTISWLVIGERKDKHMYDTSWTDDNGKVIVEPKK
jgi:hypothetical protein